MKWYPTASVETGCIYKGFLYTDVNLKERFMIYFVSYINNICSIYWVSLNIDYGPPRASAVYHFYRCKSHKCSMYGFLSKLCCRPDRASFCCLELFFSLGHLKTCNINVTYFHKKKNPNTTRVSHFTNDYLFSNDIWLRFSGSRLRGEML